MASPASRPVANGRKNGWTNTIAASGSNRPLWRMRSRNCGAPLASGEADRTTTGRIATAQASAASSQVRSRCRLLPSSTRYIGVSHQLEEDVLETLVLGHKGA